MNCFDQFFASPLPYSFRCHLVNFHGGGGGEGGGTGNGNGTGNSGGGGSGGNSDSGRDSRNSDSSADHSSSMNPDAREGAEGTYGASGMFSRDSSTADTSSYEAAFNYAPQVDLSEALTTQRLAQIDVNNYALDHPVETSLVNMRDTAINNPVTTIGSMLGLSLLGLPGLSMGFQFGQAVDNFSEMSESEQTMAALNTVTNLAPLPNEVKGLINIARSFTNPDTTIAEHLAAAVMGTWGAQTGDTSTALAGINVGYNAMNTVDKALGLTNHNLADVPGNLTSQDMGMVTDKTTRTGAPTDTGSLSNNESREKGRGSLDPASTITASLWNNNKKHWNGTDFV